MCKTVWHCEMLPAINDHEGHNLGNFNSSRQIPRSLSHTSLNHYGPTNPMNVKLRKAATFCPKCSTIKIVAFECICVFVPTGRGWRKHRRHNNGTINRLLAGQRSTERGSATGPTVCVCVCVCGVCATEPWRGPRVCVCVCDPHFTSVLLISLPLSPASFSLAVSLHPLGIFYILLAENKNIYQPIGAFNH